LGGNWRRKDPGDGDKRPQKKGVLKRAGLKKGPSKSKTGSRAGPVNIRGGGYDPVCETTRENGSHRGHETTIPKTTNRGEQVMKNDPSDRT